MRFLMFLALLAAAPNPMPKAVGDAVKAQLKDPDSAKFQGVKRYKDGSGYCGWVNAKNSYGGYTGFQLFLYTSKGGAVIIPPDLTSDPTLCQ